MGRRHALGHGSADEGRPPSQGQSRQDLRPGRHELPARRQQQERHAHRLSRRQLAADFRLPAADPGSPRRQPSPGAGEVSRPPAVQEHRGQGRDGRALPPRQALRRIRPPPHHHGHRPRPPGVHPGHHRDHAGVDQGRGDQPLRMGHADRHQLDPPRHPPQGADEADQEPQGHRRVPESGELFPPGRTFRGGPRGTRSRAAACSPTTPR